MTKFSKHKLSKPVPPSHRWWLWFIKLIYGMRFLLKHFCLACICALACGTCVSLLNLGCMDMGAGTIWRHEQFLKNYKMRQQIGHCCNTVTAPQMKCPCFATHFIYEHDKACVHSSFSYHNQYFTAVNY